MSTEESPPSHPESVVEVLQWLISVRTFSERRGFPLIPPHDAIVLSLLNTGATFAWTPTCQVQFDAVNAEMRVFVLSNVLGHRGSTPVVTPAHALPHQEAAPPPADPP